MFSKYERTLIVPRKRLLSETSVSTLPLGRPSNVVVAKFKATPPSTVGHVGLIIHILNVQIMLIHNLYDNF